jgi:hypothetical protein
MVGKVSGWKLSVVGLLAALLVAGVVQTHGKKEKGKLEAFLKKLEQKGFIVQEGSVSFPNILDMCCECELPTCYSNNK